MFFNLHCIRVHIEDWRLVIATPVLFLGAAVPAVAADQLPADVSSYLDRQEQCSHWRGEEPYDRARSNEIVAAITRLRCDKLELEAQRLSERYVRKPAVIKALDQAVPTGGSTRNPQ